MRGTSKLDTNEPRWDEIHKGFVREYERSQAS